MTLYRKLMERKEKLSVIGLGYVGMPLAVAFSKYFDVVGYDSNKKKIDLYLSGIDPTKEVGDKVIKNTNMIFTSDAEQLQEVRFHIVAVPTPIKEDKTPNLEPVKRASETIGGNLKKGSIVVYESTVYPGVTEEICVPILEKESNLKCGVDFKVGYSPERINPSDKEHVLSNIIKVVSGMDEETLEEVASVYSLITEAGVYKAESIKVAEAAKVIENSQRDINIAFMNELSIIFNRMGIDTQQVLKAAGTKWNFMKFYPGLVGGHCIGVDPYYLTHKAEMLGYHSQVILSGRRINDDMGKYIAENVVKSLIKANVNMNHAKVGILGFTFKENCQDTRNTKVIDIINELGEYGIETVVVDPVADTVEAKNLYNIMIQPIKDLKDLDCLMICVSHDEFRTLNKECLEKMYRDSKTKVLFDIKGIFERKEYEQNGWLYWRL